MKSMQPQLIVTNRSSWVKQRWKNARLVSKLGLAAAGINALEGRVVEKIFFAGAGYNEAIQIAFQCSVRLLVLGLVLFPECSCWQAFQAGYGVIGVVDNFFCQDEK
jgi:hypothetical protein